MAQGSVFPCSLIVAVLLLAATISGGTEVQPPTLTLEINGTKLPYIGTNTTIICRIQLTDGLDVNEVHTSIQWLKKQKNFTGIPNKRVTVSSLTGSGTMLQSVLKFHPLLSSDSVKYGCKVTLQAQGESSSPVISTEHMTLDVIVPSIEIITFPASVIILNVCPYNHITLNCTAKVLFEEGAKHLPVHVDWIRRRSRSDSVAFSEVPHTDYLNTGSLEEGYTSILSTNESDSANVVIYRCRAYLLIDKNVRRTSDSVVNVTGPSAPLTPESVSSLDIQSTRVTIQWTLSSIAYTPETYIVKFGTKQHSLSFTSDSQQSGPDISAANKTYSVLLSQLIPATLYYFQVAAINTARSTTSDVQNFTTTDALEMKDRDITAVVGGVMGGIIVVIVGVAAAIIALLLLRISCGRELAKKDLTTSRNMAYGVASHERHEGDQDYDYATVTLTHSQSQVVSKAGSSQHHTSSH